MPIRHNHIVGCRCHAHHTFASKQAPKHYPPDLSLEPKHQIIDLFVDVAHAKLEGIVTHTVCARRDEAHTIEFDAIDFDIERVYDPNDGDLTYTYDGEKIRILWEVPYARGEERKVAIAYKVSSPKSGVFFSQPHEHYPEDATYAATDHETERARHWLPCIDLPNVRCTLEFKLRADAAFTILANGALVDETEHRDGTKTAHWKLDYPCPSYITCFAIGDFTRADDGEFKNIPIAYFGAHTISKENLLRSFGRTGEMLSWLTKKLGQDFPYPKYYQFALPGFGGAMENISLVSWDDIFILDTALATEEWGWLVDQVNIHEMAHSYFGDAIVCRDFSHAWLKESWATYIESCWLEFHKGDDEFYYDLWRNKRAYFDESDNHYKRPIVTSSFDSSWQMYDRHLYPGGGVRLHMLRKELGDDLFWEGVHAYVARFMGKTVETSDFRRVLEEVSGRSLVRFFEQWIYTAGYPAIKATFCWDEKTNMGTFSLEQTQFEASKGKEPVFVMDIEVGWRTQEGSDHTACVHMSRDKVHLSVPMDKDPEFVRIDPGNHLVIKVDFDPGTPKLKNQLTESRDVPGRIDAAYTLAASAKPEAIDAIVKAFQSEQFWGVRQHMAKAVSRANTNHAMRALLNMLEHEQDPMVLEQLIRALGPYQEVEVRDALTARLAQNLPPMATAAAYGVLGKMRHAAPFELLKEASTSPGSQSFEPAAAARAIAESRNENAGALLISLTRHHKEGAPHRVRAAAADALSSLLHVTPKYKREPLEECLIALLRDPMDRVRMASAKALIAGNVAHASSILKAFAKTLPHQERISFEASLKHLAAPSQPWGKKMEEKVDDLTKKIRELTDTLAKLESKTQESDPSH